MLALTFSTPSSNTAGAFEGLTGFSQLCTDNDIQLIRYGTNLLQDSDAPQRMIDRFMSEIESADMLIFEGHLFWLRYFFSVPELNAAVINKIKSGTPFYLQTVRGWETFFRSNTEDCELIREVFRTIGVQPTDKQVFSDTDMATPVGGGSEAYFRSGDNCLLSDDLFQGVENIVIGQANIITCDFGAFPIIETGPMHRLVDSGDLPTWLDLSIRPMVGATIAANDVQGIVIGGRVINDAYETVFGGHVPGIENNEEVVRRIINKLTTSTNRSKRERELQNLYICHHDFERGLGFILRERLLVGDTYNLPNMLLGDIISLATANYSKISDLFEFENSGEFSKLTSSIPFGARRKLSHPIQLEMKEITDTEAQSLRAAARHIKLAVKKLKQ